MPTQQEALRPTSQGRGFADPVSEEIRVLLTRRDLRHADLARALRVSQPQATARLKGRVDWRLSELRAVAQWFDINLADLITSAGSVTERRSA